MPAGVTLDNNVHRIFRRANWNYRSNGLPTGAVDDLLLPGLRLASMLITSPTCLDFFRHIVFGNIKTDRHGKAYIEALGPEWRDRDPDPDMKVFFTDILSNWVKFDFDHTSDGADTWWACTEQWSSREEVPKQVQDDRPPMFDRRRKTYIHIHYHHHLWKYLTSRDGLQHRHTSIKAKQCFWFHFAVTTIHELAHVVYALRRRSRDAYHEDEAYFDKHNCWLPHPEMGFAWEQWMFNDIVYPRHTARGEPWDSSGGMGRYSLLDRLDFYSRGRHSHHQQWKVPKTKIETEWVQKWLQKETWERIRVEGRGWMQLPGVGVVY